MRKNRKIKVGDLFQFKVSDMSCGLGQVLISEILQYICIYEPIYPVEFIPQNLSKEKQLLSGWTMDGRFFSGDWTVIGNFPVDPNLLYPEYKVGFGSDCWITDVMGNLLRRATIEEEQFLRFESSYSSILYEEAFHAHHFGGWESRFDDLVNELKRFP